jgi:aminopeptidase N
LTLPLDGAPQAIRWNKGKWLLELTDFPRPLSMYMYQLAHDDDVLGRVEAIAALRQHMTDPEVVNAFVNAVSQDSVWDIRVRALDALAQHPLPSTSLEAVASATLRALDYYDARVRVAAARTLGKLPSTPQTVEELADRAQHDGSFFVRAAALASYLQLTGESGLALAEQVLATPSWRNTLRGPALEVLGAMPGEAAKALYEKYR